jgi:hypothetical protein
MPQFVDVDYTERFRSVWAAWGVCAQGLLNHFVCQQGPDSGLEHERANTRHCVNRLQFLNTLILCKMMVFYPRFV